MQPLSRSKFLSIVILAMFCGGLDMYATSTSFARRGNAAERDPWPEPVSNEEAWKLLPVSDGDRTESLPSWSRMLVREMPRTTATFLELDRAHRLLGKVRPDLRVAMRYVAADANRCEYSKQSARRDAEDFQVDRKLWQSIEEGTYDSWNKDDQNALRFSRAMALDSDGIADAKFAELVTAFGEDATGCMVVHSAYANFQDRFLVALNAPRESEQGLPPLKTKFDAKAMTTDPNPPAKGAVTATDDKFQVSEGSKSPKSFTWLSYDQLQERIDQQKKRGTRLPTKDWSEIEKDLPPGLFEKPTDMKWYRMVLGYAPELALPFETYMRTAGSEVRKNWDRIFGGSLFWIVTDAMKCPYCMGHCEMNWEVAGLDAKAIEMRSRVLAGDDWSSFTPAEQSALRFGRKVTLTPWEINAEDIDELRSGFGDQRALFTILNATRYNYMTRISNGFQLTLESDNPFWDYYNVKPSSK